MEPTESRSRLIEAMKRPEFYPDRPHTVDFKQTHMSYVFLTDDYVYKIKKPVRFAFVDAFGLGSRYTLCREELRLNRRLAPKVYVGVVPIIDHGSYFALGTDDNLYDAKVAEYAVKMRRLPEELMLDQLIHRGEVGHGSIQKVAEKLAAFHHDASSAAGERYGSATAVRRLVLRNFDECRRFVGAHISEHGYHAIDLYLSTFIEHHQGLLNLRAREGRVRECHGDLRCEHVCMNRSLDIFDCVEFDEQLRYADVASELAFLAMDLDSLQAEEVADELVESYVKLSGDEGLGTLLNFYKCHRACIRAKVAALKALEVEVPESERELARAQSRALFTLARSYADAGRQCLIAVCGLAGSGKSTVAEILRRMTGFEIVNSDRVRKHLAGIAEDDHPKNEYAAGIYSPEFDRLTYEISLDRSRESLRNGRGTIIDATFKNREHRQAILELGKQTRVPVLFVECRASDEETVRRLRRRAAEGTGVSDAGVEVYEHQKRDFAPLREVPERAHLVLETTLNRRLTLQILRNALARTFEGGDTHRDGAR